MPDVSVIMAVYNAAATLEEAVKSVLSQRDVTLELIAVNDGSTDESFHILCGIEDDRLQVLTQKNGGQSAALNKGTRAAKGAYIKYLDSDDIMRPGHLAAQLRALRGTQGSLASCRWGYFDSDPGKAIPLDQRTHRDYDRPIEWIADSLEHDDGMMPAWLWLIPRNLLEKSGGWDERLSLNNDFDFSIRVLMASAGVRFASDAILCYRKSTATTLSTADTRAAMESALLTTQLGTDALLRHESSPRIRKLCADRFQSWLYRFYPDFPDLAATAESRVSALGGSTLPLPGGSLLRALSRLLHWKQVRRLQQRMHRGPWKPVLRYKARRMARSRIGEGRAPRQPGVPPRP